MVWVNGFYLGTEHSGYASLSYDITDYLDYGSDNVVAVRVDASMEEGWYYEGAGIYRHVWLTKTSPLHVARYGTFATTDVKEQGAAVVVRTSLVNESKENTTLDIEENIFDPHGIAIASGLRQHVSLHPGDNGEWVSTYNVSTPKLWSLETPYLHKLVTVIHLAGKVVDTYETHFGIRTIRFDANEGFFLNGKPVKILGTNIHQDHAGVGAAIPEALQEFRIKRLKEMGSNAIRTAHNPPFEWKVN
jgi:beta-galactosidase